MNSRRSLTISLVVARADNGVIGRGGGLPWRLPADMRHLKALTLGHPVVMGRTTFESIGKPLVDRHNIVLTRDPAWAAQGVTVVRDLEAALEAAGEGEIMILGGAQVYAEALPLATRVHLTEVHAAPEGDTWLPPFGSDWFETARADHPAEDAAPAYSFVTLERRA